jgi:dTDP-4-dehydrorhamnose 3,5-epimerase
VPVVHVVPRRFEDSRGWFSESWNAGRFADWGITAEFCQDNHSSSRETGTLRGLHFQTAPHAQAKLVRCLKGRIFDVAVDIRRASPTWKHWVGVELSAARGNQLFIPVGFAHGFVTLEPDCEVAYKVDSYYAPDAERGIIWNDPEIAVNWPLSADTAPLLSDKDGHLTTLSGVEVDFAYDGNPLPSRIES